MSSNWLKKLGIYTRSMVEEDKRKAEAEKEKLEQEMKDKLEKETEKLRESLDNFKSSEEMGKLIREQAKLLRKEEEDEKERIERERKQKAREIEGNLSLLSKEKQESSEPFILLRSIELDKEKGIAVNIDFNDAFISYLKKAGITGDNDDDIVKRWLAHLSQDIQRMSSTMDYIDSMDYPEETIDRNKLGLENNE